tara:strand:- start:741 stop:1058 length:318 start_codon:yes stop_codon:yes gene_type:complete
MLSKENLTHYAQLKYRQIRFELVEWMAKERAEIFVSAMLGIIFLGVLIFGSFFGAFWLNSLMESEFLGFGLIALCWLLSFLLLLLFRKAIIARFFHNYTNQNIPK